jgi:EpsI family protein
VLRRTACLLFPGLLLCLVGTYRVLDPPGEGATSRLEELPTVLLGCKGEELPVADAVLDDLGSDDILVRRYGRPDGLPIWVVLIYFVNSRLGGHDPQLCYVSQGYRVEEMPALQTESALGPLEAERFVARRPGRAERVATFWYTPGKRLVSDVRRYRNSLFLQGLRENRSYGVFVRVSTVENGLLVEGDAWNERFAAELASILPTLIVE